MLDIGGYNNIDNEIAILKSRTVAKTVVEDLIKLAKGSKASVSINNVVGECLVIATAIKVSNSPSVTQLLTFFDCSDSENISIIIASNIVPERINSGQ